MLHNMYYLQRTIVRCLVTLLVSEETTLTNERCSSDPAWIRLILHTGVCEHAA